MSDTLWWQFHHPIDPSDVNHIMAYFKRQAEKAWKKQDFTMFSLFSAMCDSIQPYFMQLNMGKV